MFYTEDIFVYTPNGKLIHLPRGATPLDFAFQVHSEVGVHCAGSKVNGRLVPLSTELKTADFVEIITNPNRTPSHDWLKLVKTSRARAKIKKWLKQTGFEQSVLLGKQIIERKLKGLRLKMPGDDVLQEVAEKLGRKTVESLYAAISEGAVTGREVVGLIAPEEEEKHPEGFVGKFIERVRGSKGIKIHGMDNMMFRFAGCCQPIPGDDIVGFITRGRGVTIHQANCPSSVYVQTQFPERKIDVSWDTGKDQSFMVELELVVEDRKNVLRDLTQAMSDADTNVRAAEMHMGDTTAIGKFVVEVTSLSHLNRIFDKVRKVKGVISVFRTKGKEQVED